MQGPERHSACFGVCRGRGRTGKEVVAEGMGMRALQADGPTRWQLPDWVGGGALLLQTAGDGQGQGGAWQRRRMLLLI